jgi:hypothetical protein
MTEQAKRISGMGELDDTVMCYWHTSNGWLLYIPGCGVGTLSAHSVVENADGTITVTPSILMHGHNDGQPTTRHGYLTNGEWREC